MVHGIIDNIFQPSRFAVDFAYGLGREEMVQRISAQGNDEPGMEKGKLRGQPWRASIDLLRQRVTVLRRTTLDYI